MKKIMLGPWQTLKTIGDTHGSNKNFTYKYVFGTNIMFAYVIESYSRFSTYRVGLASDAYTYGISFPYSIHTESFISKSEAQQYVDNYLLGKGIVLLGEEKATKLSVLI